MSEKFRPVSSESCTVHATTGGARAALSPEGRRAAWTGEAYDLQQHNPQSKAYLMVGSSPDKRVRAAVREHAGAELSEYRSFTVEYETLVDSGHVGPLTRQQARTKRSEFAEYIIDAADRSGNLTTAQKGSRPVRKQSIKRVVGAMLDEIDEEIRATAPSPQP